MESSRAHKAPLGVARHNADKPTTSDSLVGLFKALKGALEDEVDDAPVTKAAAAVRSKWGVGSRYNAKGGGGGGGGGSGATQGQPEDFASSSRGQPPPSGSVAGGLNHHHHHPHQASHQQQRSMSMYMGPRAGGGGGSGDGVEVGIAPSAPPIPMTHRAIHPLFLKQLLASGMPAAPPPPTGAPPPLRAGVHGATGAPPLQHGITVADVVSGFVVPFTRVARMSLVQALSCGKVSLPWCRDARFGEQFARQFLTGRPVHGPASFFVSFSGDEVFADLVAAIMSHYGDLPESAGARAPPPVYYFLSPFAVNQHQHADPRKNPDASFEPVLQRCRALLLAGRPWHAPKAIWSAWALYEVLTAVKAGIALEVLQTDSDVDLAGIFDGMDERAHRDGGDANDDEDGGLLVSEPSAAAAATGWRAGARGGGGAGEGSGRGSAASDEGGGWRTDGAGGGGAEEDGGGAEGGRGGGRGDGNGGGDSGGDSGGGSGSGGGGVHGAADALVAETIGALDVLSAGSLGHGRVCGPGARFDHEYAIMMADGMLGV
ncbi:hypothetical protein FOA52_011519 [Chlamydomonas sp. UWO 241]|nr:hypothetical protein FOA52_011519 [Chlamydomonas sp. UWO 241]